MVGDDRKTGRVGGVEGLCEMTQSTRIEDMFESKVSARILLSMMSVSEDIVMVADVFRVRDEGDVRVTHNELVILENVFE